MQELWKPIEGYEGLYEISNFGNVKSNFYYHSKQKNVKLLKPVKTNSGYLNVSLIDTNKVRKEHRVHRLVAKAFIPNPECKPHINHIDNDRTNNIITNLEWCTCKENLLHAQKQGRLFDAQSKGGKKGSLIRKENSIKEINSLIGTKFNRLTLLGFVKFEKRNAIVKVQCECGNIEEKIFRNVKNGNTKQCLQCWRNRFKLKKDSINEKMI